MNERSIWYPLEKPKVIATYEGKDIQYNGIWLTRVLVKGTGCCRDWIRKSLLPENPVVDTQYEIPQELYRAVHI